MGVGLEGGEPLQRAQGLIDLRHRTLGQVAAVHPLTHARPQHGGGLPRQERWHDGGLVAEPVPVELGDHQRDGDGLAGSHHDLGAGLDGALVVEHLDRHVEHGRLARFRERDRKAECAIGQGVRLDQPGGVVGSGPHQRSRDGQPHRPAPRRGRRSSPNHRAPARAHLRRIRPDSRAGGGDYARRPPAWGEGRAPRATLSRYLQRRLGSAPRSRPAPLRRRRAGAPG